MLVDWWAASGRAQSLDVGWLSFTREEVMREEVMREEVIQEEVIQEEVEAAVGSGAHDAVERMEGRRWFHGLEKAFGGYGLRDSLGLASAFADWATAVRFDPEVIAARVARWWR